VKVVDNRNYADVLTFGAHVSAAQHDNGGNPLQYEVSKLIAPHLKSDQLYIPPLAGGSVSIPDTPFTSPAIFRAGPTKATLFADVVQIAFGGINVTKLGGIFTKIAEGCGQFLTGAALPTSEAAIVALVESASGCLDRVVTALASSGSLDGRTLSQLDAIGGTLTFLDHLTLVGTTIGVAAELSDLVLGATVDKDLRQFAVYRMRGAPPVTRAGTQTSPPTQAGGGAAAMPTASDTVGDSIRTSISFSPAITLDEASLPSGVLSECGLDVSRAMAVKMVLAITATSGLEEQATFEFPVPITDPGLIDFYIDVSQGPQCIAQGNGTPTVEFQLAPEQTATFTSWVIYVDAITPDTPAEDVQALGNWLIQAPEVGLPGNYISEDVWGPRVVSCGDAPEDDVSYLVPAGTLPSGIESGLGAIGCSGVPSPTGGESS
jgi:hypothetical protein